MKNSKAASGMKNSTPGSEMKSTDEAGTSAKGNMPGGATVNMGAGAGIGAGAGVAMTKPDKQQQAGENGIGPALHGEFRTGPVAGTTIIKGVTFQRKPVQYSEVDGMAIFEGDIVLGTVDEVRAAIDIEAGLVQMSVGIPEGIGRQFRWPNATIPFEIDAAMPNPTRVIDAIAHWEANTRIRFVQRTAANAAQFTDFVRFVDGGGCSSSVGRRGGMQTVTLGAGCGTGNAIHEIGHTVGLWHEQSREDRDTFVRIDWANIDPAMQHNFDQHIVDGDDLGPYDYASIMHYPATAFSTNGQPTIVPLQPLPPGIVIGQRNGLSAGDIAGVHMMYPAASGDSGPVVAWGSNRLDAFVIGTDSALYHKWWDGANWGPSLTDWEYMGGVCMSPPEVVAWGPNRLDVFVLGTDRALYHKWWDGANWGPSLTDWEYMGGICTSPPKVVAWGPNRLDVFVLGTDRALYHKWWDGANWGPSLTDWEYMGGICTSPPEVVAWGPNRLDVFVTGTDSALYHKWWDGANWGPSLTDWEYMGGICTSPPKAVAWGPNRLDVFVLGTDRALYHKWWDGANWGPSLTDYESLGGICTSPPEVVAWGPNRLDVFVTGTDSALFHKWWDGANWGPSLTDYESLGGICTSPPRVVAWGPNRLDVFVTGTDSALFHKWWDGANWGPSIADYEYMGGVIRDF